MAKYSKEDRPKPTPKTPKSWDVPPPPASGDKTADALYAAIGFALTKWGRLENEIAGIFGCLVTGGEPEPAIRAFGSVITFRGRKEMLEAAAEAYFFLYRDAEPIKKPLKDFLDEANSFSARRNEIAHGIVQENMPPIESKHLEHHIAFLGKSVPKTHPKFPLGFVLRPMDSTTNKTQMEESALPIIPVTYLPDYVYSSAEVLKFAEHFERLEVVALRISMSILAHRAQTLAGSLSSR